MDFYFSHIVEYRQMFIDGAWLTLKLTAIAVAVGTVLGLIGALCRLAYFEKGNVFLKSLGWVLRTASLAYVTFFRGTPLFVQIFIWYFVWSATLINPTDGWLISGETARYLRSNYGAILAGMMALSVNAGAYITEIFRGGIQSIDKGQFEAAKSLGLTYAQSMRYVILPQAIRRMLPPLGNEFITLLKDSSLVSAIGVAELAYAGRTVMGAYARAQEPYYTVALIYLVMTIGLAYLFSWLEKKMSFGHER